MFAHEAPRILRLARPREAGSRPAAATQGADASMAKPTRVRGMRQMSMDTSRCSLHPRSAGATRARGRTRQSRDASAVHGWTLGTSPDFGTVLVRYGTGTMAFSFGRTADLLRLPLADTDGGPGLRRAQIAAAHSVAAHFWSQTQAALVVMPTGSGKSAVMVLSAILLRARRVLVIVPSRLLREQIVEKFKKLDPLREVGALEKGAPLPFVIERDQRVTTAADWTSLERADVVVTLPHAASPGLAGVPLPPPDLFDLILVDEAHHVPARIYRALADAFPTAKRVQFTATPFRRDRKEIQGDLVFTYDLAQARRDGIFGQLRFVPVTVEEDTQRARDEAIARAAARQLRLDREQGFEHRIPRTHRQQASRGGAGRRVRPDHVPEHQADSQRASRRRR